MLPEWSRARLLLLPALAGFICAGALAAIYAVLMMEFGWYDVSASTPHGPVAAWALHHTMSRSVRMRSAGIRAPAHFTQAQIMRGFRLYDTQCVTCHGAPGISRAKWVMGLTPTPPYLIDAGKTWSPAELKFIITHGIKMTAMPSWGATRSEPELWSLVAFLTQLPGITPVQYAQMRKRQAP